MATTEETDAVLGSQHLLTRPCHDCLGATNWYVTLRKRMELQAEVFTHPWYLLEGDNAVYLAAIAFLRDLETALGHTLTTPDAQLGSNLAMPGLVTAFQAGALALATDNPVDGEGNYPHGDAQTHADPGWVRLPTGGDSNHFVVFVLEDLCERVRNALNAV